MKPIAQRGIAIVSAIFILLVLAVLGAFVINITTTQHMSSAQDLLSARAYQAARAGIEWGEYQVTINGSCVASTTLTMPATATTLTAFKVTVLCPTPITVGSQTVYRITATACNQGATCPNTTNPNAQYIERQLEVTL